MDKIFDKEVIKYLNELGMAPKDIATLQHKKLKDYAVSKLRQVADLLEAEMFDDIRGYLANSPAGDGYGSDNEYINFGGLHDTDMDIGELMTTLKMLKKEQ
jgi:hypothetical protein